jgi:hypothetical protein
MVNKRTYNQAAQDYAASVIEEHEKAEQLKGNCPDCGAKGRQTSLALSSHPATAEELRQSRSWCCPKCEIWWVNPALTPLTAGKEGKNGR